MSELRGKTALVTGAGGAIGSAIAADLAAAGAALVLLDRDAEALARTTAAHGGQAIALDLADPAAIAGAMADLAATGTRIDILVNNAGRLSAHKLAATTLPDWHALMAVNLDAAFLLTQACAPGMVEAGWGRIVNIASFAWKSGGLTAGTAYAVSKAALVGLTLTTARELAAKGITANALAPAYVVSPMVLDTHTPEERARLCAAIPVGRFCEPAEVAHAVRFLAAPRAGFITGTVLDMNGGLQFL